MAKISITRALAELKRIEERLQVAIADGVFVGVTVGKDTKQRMLSGVDSIEQAKRRIQSSIDTIEHLVARRDELKSRIVMSNAVTQITLGGKTMTVAEAIETKRTNTSRKELVNAMKRQLNASNATIQTNNLKVEAQIETNLATVYGAGDKSKVDAATFESIAKPQRDSKEAALLDPLNLIDRIAKLEEQISLVETELDFTLSESNSRTEIEVAS